MKNIIKPLGIPALALVVALSVSCAVSAWTAPTATPPNGNTAAPLNISSSEQTKTGNLILSSLLKVGNTITTSGLTVSNTVQISPITNPLYSASQYGLKLGVNGKTGSQQYCDEKGQNCFSAEQIVALINNSTTSIQTPASTSTPTVNCSAYTLSVCPANGVCSQCTGNGANNQFKLDSCNSGYSVSGNQCVSAAVAVSNITLLPATLSCQAGGTGQIAVSIVPTNATDKTITWRTSNPAVATANNGTVSCVGAGTAIITAQVGNIQRPVSVTVTKPVVWSSAYSKTLCYSKTYLNTELIYNVGTGSFVDKPGQYCIANYGLTARTGIGMDDFSSAMGAKEYCDSLNEAGVSKSTAQGYWRLPTRQDFESGGSQLGNVDHWGDNLLIYNPSLGFSQGIPASAGAFSGIQTGKARLTVRCVKI
jgi:hypothetical protein